MNGPTPSDYRPWDESGRDSAWFHFRGVGSQLREHVRPLSAEYAEELWRWVFPTTQDVLPLVAEDRKGWLRDVFAGEPTWFGGVAPPLSEILSRSFAWDGGDTVYFLTRRGTGYETTWRVFRESGEQFLGWDDEGLLFHPTRRDVAVFWDVSRVRVGRRSKRALR